jgi:hypothetical protein
MRKKTPLTLPATSSRRERVRAMLADLKMPGALEAVDGILHDLDGGATTGAEAIEALLGAQIGLRNDRRLQAAMRSSRLPAVKTLADFDFAFQPSIKRDQIESLHELGFVERCENVILLGPPGVGKTHLAISLAIEAAKRGRRVYYGTLSDLITGLEEAQAAGNLQPRLKVLTHPSLLVVDEIGYLPISPASAPLPRRADPRQQLPATEPTRTLAAPRTRRTPRRLNPPPRRQSRLVTSRSNRTFSITEKRTFSVADDKSPNTMEYMALGLVYSGDAGSRTRVRTAAHDRASTCVAVCSFVVCDVSRPASPVANLGWFSLDHRSFSRHSVIQFI